MFGRVTLTVLVISFAFCFELFARWVLPVRNFVLSCLLVGNYPCVIVFWVVCLLGTTLACWYVVVCCWELPLHVVFLLFVFWELPVYIGVFVCVLRNYFCQDCSHA